MAFPIGPAFFSPMNQPYIIAIGGTVSFSGNFKIHTFTSSGTLTVLNAPPTATYDSLLAAGGGGGAGSGQQVGGGGGGAGGYLPLVGQVIGSTGANTITIGPGGTAGNVTSGVVTPATNGTNSSASGPSIPSQTCVGGGFGSIAGNAGSGGSGGGCSGSSGAAGVPGNGTLGQGFAGAQGSGPLGTGPCFGGGGGGAGGVPPGSPGSTQFGPGVSNSITGSAVTYCRGGTGNDTTGGIPPPANPPANTGQGGDGAVGTIPAAGSGAPGSTGVYIFRYKYQN